MKVKRMENRLPPFKTELFVNGLEDNLEETQFPLEGRFSGEIDYNVIHPIPEKYFNFGLETNYHRTLSDVIDRKFKYPHYLFTDHTFPPRQKVLVRNDSMDKVFWRRPHQMSESPQLFVDGISRFDVIQGEAGDCYFLASCSALSMQPKLLEKLIPPRQSLDRYDPNYTGLLRFRFWQYGRWKEIVIDDWLPTKDGRKPLYARSTNPDEFWVAFLEKAYAKLHGSYEAICGGFNANALMDLTGGMTYYHDLADYSPIQVKELFYTILRGVSHQSFVCCGMEAKYNPVTREGVDIVTGLVVNHAYTITGATEIRLKNGKFQQIVRIRNPWGEGTEWKKEWSDNSSNWQNVRRRTLRKLHVQIADDGEWWMPYEEFQKYFQHVTICTLGPDFDQDGRVFQERWLCFAIHGSWKIGVNAGGSGNNIFKYASNPQYMIKLAKPDEHSPSDNKTISHCFIQIGLMQEYRKANENFEFPMLGLGIRVYKIKRQKADRLNRRFLASPSNVVLQTKIYKQQREVCVVGKLEPGNYVIIPSTFYPNEETSYLLRIFTEKEIKIKQLL